MGEQPSAVHVHVGLKADMEEMAAWLPDRSAAFLSGVAKVLAAGQRTHHHCSAGCEKAQAERNADNEWRCAKCGAPWIECSPETCG